MINFNPNDPNFILNPYPTFRQLHASDEPIFWNEESGMWFAYKHEDLTSLLRDKRLGRQITHIVEPSEVGIPPRNPDYEPFDKLSDNSMFDKEPPDHTRIKSLVQSVFTPRRVNNLAGSIQDIANDLIDDMLDSGRNDLLEDYAVPLPVEVIAELLGIPKADRKYLRPWSADIVKMYELTRTEETAMNAVRASQEFSDYLRDLSRERRENPTDDLISALAQAEDNGETLTEDELISTCILLLNAGHEATVNGFGNGMLALFNHPDAMQKLQHNLDLVPSALEEMLRYDSPLQLFRRWVLEDFKYKGHQFELGQEIAFLYGAANHDPDVFESPEIFDIERSPNPHVTFSIGIHFCLGAPLARLELQTSIRTLLERLPNIKLAEIPEFHEAFVIRGLKSLRVSY